MFDTVVIRKTDKTRHLTEDELLAKARAGNLDAFENLLRLHDEAMRALAWKMLGDRHAMEDALQDAYLKAYRSVGRFRGDSKFQSWLHRIVSNCCIDSLRTQTKLREEPFDDKHDGLTQDAYRLIHLEPVQVALQTLSPQQRSAILLVDCEGYSYQEVADMFNTTTGTVGSWVSRARTNLRKSEAFL